MNEIATRIDAVRRFNRFYTQRIGVLQEGLADSRFTLAEARVLFELAHRPGRTASEIGRDLGLDAGYLSRILRRFAADGLLARQPDPADNRRAALRLTAAGEAAFAPLDSRTVEQIGALLAPLPGAAQEQLVGALGTVEALLDAASGWQLRAGHRPGDIGWVVSRHGALYAAEYGWDMSFEALVAEIGAAFVRNFDPARERCWIAERDGVRLGSVILVRQTEEVAKLRLLLVEPAARGLGIGRRLVRACTEFARAVGYRRIMLWTNSCLLAARAIYAAEGYVLTAAEPHHSFGQDLVGETWELALA